MHRFPDLADGVGSMLWCLPSPWARHMLMECTQHHADECRFVAATRVMLEAYRESGQRVFEADGERLRTVIF